MDDKISRDEIYNKANELKKRFPDMDRRDLERLLFKYLDKDSAEYAKEGSERAIKLGKKKPNKYPKDFEKNAELDLGMHRSLAKEARKSAIKKKSERGK